MKTSEKNAVKNAFSIPDPQRKDEFIAAYSRRLTNRRSSPVPIIMKYAAAAAVIIVIAVIGVLKFPSPDKEFTGSDLITATSSSEASENNISETTSETVTAESTTVPDDNSVTTTATTSGNEKSSGTVTASTTSDAASQTSSAEKTTSANTTTKTTTSAKTTASKTTTARTTATTSAQTTAAATQTTTSEEQQTDAVVTTEQPHPTNGADYTVKPPVIYYPQEDNGNDPPCYADPEDGDTGSEPPPMTTDPSIYADTVIKGTIIRTYYTSVNGQPYIQADVQISEFLRNNFDLAPNSCISFYIPGGYLPDGHGGYEKIEAQFTPQIGKEYLILLERLYSPFPDMTFMISYPIRIAVFREEGDRYYSEVNGNIYYRKSELENLINS